jgi:hypothetical protein
MYYGEGGWKLAKNCMVIGLTLYFPRLLFYALKLPESPY